MTNYSGAVQNSVQTLSLGYVQEDTDLTRVVFSVGVTTVIDRTPTDLFGDLFKTAEEFGTVLAMDFNGVITILPAILKRSNERGVNNTGRWNNVGPSPRDGNGVGFDYWEKLSIDPDAVNLGNVVSTTVFDATLQNRFRRKNKTISSIVNNAGAGITVSGPAIPAVAEPFSDKIYVVTISTSGPPVINGSINFTIGGEILSVLVEGTRIIIFPYPPESNIKETLSWLTDIVKSVNGTEQRQALRQYPRQQVTYEVQTTNINELNNVKNLMVDWTTRVFGVPIWWYERQVALDITSGDLIVHMVPGSLDAVDLRVGGLAMVFYEQEDGTMLQDTLQVTYVGMSTDSPQDRVEFATGVNRDYPARLTTVVPVVAGIIPKGVKSATPRDAQTATWTLSFELLDNIATVPDLEVGTYDKLEDPDGISTVIVDDPNFMQGNTMGEEFQQVVTRTDFGVGLFQQETQELRARRSTPHKWIVTDVANEWTVRSLLYFLRGRLRTIWLPTQRDDFIVVADIGNGAATVDVSNANFTAYVAGNKPYSGLRITTTSGQVSYHRITDSVEVDADTERLSINPSTTFEILLENVERADLMVLCRQANDSVALNHTWFSYSTLGVETEIDTSFIGDVQS